MMPLSCQVAKKAPEVIHFTWLADAKSAMARQEPVTTFGTGGLIEDGVTTASKEADSTNFRNIDDENDIFREHEGPNKIHESTTPLDESVTPPKNEPVDDRTYSQKFVDDVSEALLNPVQTARNAAEKYIHCVRFLKGKG